MRLFSTRKNKSNTTRKTGRKVLIVTGVMLALFMAGPVLSNNSSNSVFGMTTYAAEQTQSAYTWVQDETGAWKVKDAVGNVLSNVMFCDVDGSWYMLNGNGNMVTGLVNDNGHFFYFENTGKMRVQSGDYGGFMLYINQGVNGTLGEITVGVENLLNTGVVAQSMAMPVVKVYALSTPNNDALSPVDTSQNSDLEKARAEAMAILYGQTGDKDSYAKAFTQEELNKMAKAIDEIR